jgi:hypothetical protein
MYKMVIDGLSAQREPALMGLRISQKKLVNFANVAT